MITTQSILHTIDVDYKSGRYGAYYEVTMVDERGDVCVTYVDESMDNWWHWAQVCKQQDTGFILTGCHQKTRRRTPQFTSTGAPIVDADSLPEILMTMPMVEMHDEIAAMLDSLGKGYQDKPGDSLFDYE